jgi:hypothetical protein
MAERPKLFKINTEMQRWCALLEQEVLAWPEVTTRPMFGMIGFYHGDSIFAAIPRTRAAGTARSVLIKLPGLGDTRLKPELSEIRVKAASGPGSGWVTFELESANDINEALLWLERAYERTL